ncbi:amidohydrolase family protein [Microbacterium sp. NPDC055903]
MTMPGLRRVPGGFIGGGFTDHHVHLQLVDRAGLTESVLARVIDLGGDPLRLAALAQGAEGRQPLAQDAPVEIVFAGAFLTPPGGYPSDRAWAPPGSVREIADADAAADAVDEMASAGASFVKVASNSTAGPVFSDELLRAILGIAASARLPVIVHAEGPGEAQRAVRLGARLLAHAPFSERLDDTEIAAHATGVQWISTLSIHEGDAYEIAVDNVRRFHAAGGTVLYGTDMGNGPTPVALNPREIAALREAGIHGLDLLRALAPRDTRALFHPADDEIDIDPLRARALSPDDLEA